MTCLHVCRGKRPQQQQQGGADRDWHVFSRWAASHCLEHWCSVTHPQPKGNVLSSPLPACQTCLQPRPSRKCGVLLLLLLLLLQLLGARLALTLQGR